MACAMNMPIWWDLPKVNEIYVRKIQKAMARTSKLQKKGLQ
jgi:hypothetical protein